MTRRARPAQAFDAGLQHERTTLAWERTAVAMMVAGALLARYAAHDAHPWIALIGVAQAVAGAGLLVWAGIGYEARHHQLRAGEALVHPRAVRVTGVGTVAFTLAALVLAVLVTVTG
jgi:uncharacterized membrane protein YidH (DUF202 family)